jgi:HEAT repeat protein
MLAVTYAEPSGVAALRVVRALVSLLAHENETVAERAVSLLMLFPSESSRPLACTLRAECSPDVRRRAAQALGACRQDMAVNALVTALRDPAPGVRAAAARSIPWRHARPRDGRRPHAAGGDTDEGVREAPRSALQELGTAATATSIAAGFGLVAQRSG